MRKSNWIAVTVLSSAVAMGSAAAYASDANANNCLEMARQVKTALADNPQAPDYDSARKAQSNGRDFCVNGFYDRGVAYYGQALAFLGAGKS